MNTDGTSQDTGSEGLSEMDAASRIEALLAGSGDSEGDETKRKPTEASTSEEDEDEAPTGDEDEASEDESEGEEDADDSEEQPQTFTVKIDGQDVPVTLDELKNGYSRTQDYTRKTMELAEARKALEPELQALRTEREQYAQLLPQLFAHLQNQANSPELEHLRMTDPAEWAARKHELSEQEAAIRLEYERVSQEQARDAERKQEEEAKAEAQALLKADPKFAEPGVYTDVKAYGLQIGFTPEDLHGNLDHKAWITLRKAMLYDQLQAKGPAVKAKVEAVKTAKPGATARQPLKVTDVTRAKQRLAKTGRVEDAAAAIERMLS